MLVSQRFNQRIVGRQLGGVRFSGQDCSGDSVTAFAFDVPNEVCKGPALPDEIVYQKVPMAALHFTSEEGLICEPLKPARPCVTHSIRLHDGIGDGQAEPL